MDKDLMEKIQILKEINTDDSNFILNIFEAYKKNKSEVERKKQSTTIVLDNQQIITKDNIINLNSIWVKPYLYTRMRALLKYELALIY